MLDARLTTVGGFVFIACASIRLAQQSQQIKISVRYFSAQNQVFAVCQFC
ncbi:MAG TPA: hypothetical protein PLB25_01470 [Rhodoferax sp.]|nr:hypothetical protein [Rhodoferax sp.]